MPKITFSAENTRARRLASRIIYVMLSLVLHVGVVVVVVIFFSRWFIFASFWLAPFIMYTVRNVTEWNACGTGSYISTYPYRTDDRMCVMVTQR